MFLSKLVLNLSCPRVRMELSNIYEVHRTIMRAFPEEKKDVGRVLFRIEDAVEGKVTILVQSIVQPEWSKLVVPSDFFAEPPQSKTFNPNMVKGQGLFFRLMANPTVKRDGKRWGLMNEEEMRAWMERKASENGFSLLSCNVVLHRAIEGDKDNSTSLKFLSVTFEGTLRVNDQVKFRNALEMGIGSGKGFGFGLLSIATLG